MEPSQSTVYRSFLLTAVAVLGVMGVALKLPAFLALGAAWAAMLVAAWQASRWPIEGITARRELYPSAFEGDEVGVELVVASSRPARMVEVLDAFGPSISVGQRMLESGPIGPGVERRLRYTAYCSRQWGLHTVGPIQVFTSDPGGLFHASSSIPVTEVFAVFPQVYDVAGLAELGARSTLVAHEHSAGRPGQSMISMGVREYRTGDDLRRVHWPATARCGTLMVKEVEVDLAPYYTVILDLDRRHRAGMGRKSTLEYVLRTGASVIWSAIRSGGFVQVSGLGANPLHVPPGRGESHLTFALDELIRTGLDGTIPLPEAALQILPFVPQASTVVLVSGTVFLDLSVTGDLIEALQGRGTRVAMLLVNNFSFPAISGWPPPRAEILEKSREVAFFLGSRGVSVKILEESDDLGAALGAGWAP